MAAPAPTASFAAPVAVPRRPRGLRLPHASPMCSASSRRGGGFDAGSNARRHPDHPSEQDQRTESPRLSRRQLLATASSVAAAAALQQPADASTMLGFDWPGPSDGSGEAENVAGHAVSRRTSWWAKASGTRDDEDDFTVYQVRPDESVTLSPLSLREALAAVAAPDVDALFLGEHHFSLVDHELQARIVEGVHRRVSPRGRRVAVALEMVQQRYQPALDAYVEGRIDELDLYVQSNWDENWVWPFENMLPVFRVARRLRLPLVALSPDSGVLDEIRGTGGMAKAAGYFGGAAFERLNSADSAFQAYVNANIVPSYAAHARAGVLLGKPSFSAFYNNRVVRDEAMAARAETYLADNPGTLLVGLVGVDHVKFGAWGVPGRVRRRHADRRAAEAAEEARRAEAEGTAGPLRREQKLLCLKTVVLNPTAADAFDERDGALMLGLPAPGREVEPISDLLWFSSRGDAMPRSPARRRTFWSSRRWERLPSIEELADAQ